MGANATNSIEVSAKGPKLGKPLSFNSLAVRHYGRGAFIRNLTWKAG